MPAPDEGPRISWSAYLPSFYVVATVSYIYEPSTESDRDDIVSSGTYVVFKLYPSMIRVCIIVLIAVNDAPIDEA